MFTGIVEETGRIEKITATRQSIRFAVRARVCGRQIKVGDSLAVNGCCLTVVTVSRRGSDKILEFDLLRETWRRTNLQFTAVGSSVNLERALAANGRLGGHFVTGHIDGVGRVLRWKNQGSDWELEIGASPEIMRYVVFKGAVAVDGISLTVAYVRRRSFGVWIIPHTYERTALNERAVGDSVNLEADLLGKYVEKFLAQKPI